MNLEELVNLVRHFRRYLSKVFKFYKVVKPAFDERCSDRANAI